MTAVSTTITPYATTDTAWRAAIQAWSEAFDDVGLTKTSATGQVDYTTITTATTSAYEQRTWVTDGVDLCVRLTYTLGSSRPQLDIRLYSDFPAAASSTGSYGVGSMTMNGTQAQTDAHTCYLAAGGDYFTLALKNNASPSTVSMFAGGWARLSNGGYLLVNSNSAASGVSSISGISVYSDPGSITPLTGGSSSWPIFGAKGDVVPDVEFYRWPVRPADGEPIEFPDAVCVIGAGALSPWVSVTVGAKTYLPTPCGSATTMNLAIRYE